MNNTYRIGLVSKSYFSDEIGNMIEEETISYVFADLKSISAKEFFDGGESGLKPEHKFIVRSFEYSNETEVEFNNMRYSIYRSYRRDDGFVELYAEKKVGVSESENSN